MKFVFAFFFILTSQLIFSEAFAEEAKVERIQPLIQAEDVVANLSAPPMTAVEKAKEQIKTSESDIPLKLVDTHRSNNIESPWMRMLYSLLIVGVMAAVSVFYIKRKKGIQKSMGPAPQIKMLTQFHLGPKKSLAIIHVAGEAILIGVTDQNISLIKGLSLIDDEIPAQAAPLRFADALDESEEFSIKGIQDVVSQKLKSMRSLQ